MATYDLTNSIPSKIKTGDILNCPYSGSAKSITLPKGEYKLEVWGAQGGDYSTTYFGGVGGYSCGKITLVDEETNFILYAGGKGATATTTATYSGGFNGGGDSCFASYNSSTICASGGGASDIRLGQDSLYARIIVAGGGGGATSRSSTYQPTETGYGGGLVGGPIYSGVDGATQTGVTKKWNECGFGFGAGRTSYVYNNCATGAGGGGWYGGADWTADTYLEQYYGRGGGGSGYVYTASTAANYPSGCLLNSSYYLEDAQTIAGNTSFTSPSGTAETGHTGDGYCRITVLNARSFTPMFVKENGVWRPVSQIFYKNNGEWQSGNWVV